MYCQSDNLLCLLDILHSSLNWITGMYYWNGLLDY